MPSALISPDSPAVPYVPSAHILVVDDDQELLSLNLLILTKAGYNVSCASTGAEARKAIAERRPDVILLDINLPDVSGFDLCREFKQNPVTAGIAILHLSGDCVSTEEQVTGLNGGADGYVIRPIEGRELVARIEATLRVRRTEVELRRVTEQLKAASRSLRQMFDYSLDAICSLNSELQFVEVSAAAETMWGYSREELIGRRCIDLVHSADVAKTEAQLASVKAGVITRNFENRFVRKDGGIVMQGWSATWSEENRTMFCVVRDVTEGRVTERVLQRMGQRLQGTLESMTDAFYMLDHDYHFTYVNSEAERLLQRSREEILYSCIWDEFPEAMKSEVHAEFERCFKENRPAHFEFYYEPFDRWFEVHAFPSEENLAVYFRDTTERRQNELLLRESHERFLNVVRATNHLVWEWDLVKDEVWWGDGFENRFGHITSEISPTERFWYDHIHPEDRERVYQGLWKCIGSGQRSWNDEYRFRRADGTYAYVHDRGYILHDAEGKSVRAIGGLVDMTIRHEQEQRLRESEARFRLLADNVEDAFWIIDAKSHQTLYVNPAFQRMRGLAAEALELESNAYIDSIHPADRDRVRDATDKNRAGFNEEYRVMRPDGSVLWVWARMVPVYDGEGNISRIVGIARDVTQRKEAEALICEQAALLDKAQEAIYVVDLDGDILFWNRSAERIYGITAIDVLGGRFMPYTTGLSEAHEEARRKVLEHGDWMGELIEHTAGGKEIIVEGHWTLVRDPDGYPKSILCINSDITDRKKLETQILRAQRMESIGTLAGGMAHDLNNVLTPIIMSIGMLKKENLSDDSHSILDTIESSAIRGADMVQQVLSFARGVKGERMPIQPGHLVKDIQKIVADTFPKDIELKVVIKPNLWSVLGDPTQLHQVMLNLCVNARDAMPNGGRITVTLSNITIDENYAATNIEAHVGPHVLVEVHDTGTGMPPDIIEKIYDPFFTTKELGKGTGLGLSTSLAIVKSHGGFIRTYSELGRGSDFKVHLPAMINADQAAPMEMAKHLPRGNGELILLVDDELPIRSVAEHTLQSFGYRVVLASDGAEAIAQYAKHQSEIAVVITDMMMPIMDGQATIEVLTRMNPDVKIVAASGMNANGNFARVSSRHVKRFLSKPYTTDAILQALADALGRDVNKRP